MVCCMVLAIMLYPFNANVQHWNRSAAVPTVTTAASSRKTRTRSGAVIHMIAAKASIAMVATFTQNQNPFITR